MHLRAIALFVSAVLMTVVSVRSVAAPAEQPIAIFHAFNQTFRSVEKSVCILANQGYSHVQISPAQKSNPNSAWWARYQPVDYGKIEGLGTKDDLARLIKTAHKCNVKVIADVVFNHMANLDQGENAEDLSKFPSLTPNDFNRGAKNPSQKPCDINYSDGNRSTELNCWLGGVPDLNQSSPTVRRIQKAHLKLLMDLGIDGFRFDAAKHMPAQYIQEYINYINQYSRGNAWNYLEVIQDTDTRAEDYNRIAAVTDFLLYTSMKEAFSFGGDLRSLRIPRAINDSRSVTFGRNHDTIRELNPNYALNPYSDRTDSYLATAYVLARQNGTPLIFNWDNADAPFIPTGVKFRQIMSQRGKEGRNVKDNVLAVVNSPTLLVIERGAEGFFIVNKAREKFDSPAIDLTLTNLEGCYRELRNNFRVAIERRSNGKKYVTRWGTANRGGMEVQGRDALYFIREPWERCR
jgi:alpha-amylase